MEIAGLEEVDGLGEGKERKAMVIGGSGSGKRYLGGFDVGESEGKKVLFVGDGGKLV